jgi:hypothetical protein
MLLSTQHRVVSQGWGIFLIRSNEKGEREETTLLSIKKLIINYI